MTVQCLVQLLALSPDENSNQSFLSDVYQPKIDNSSSTSSSQQVSPPHSSSLRTEDSQPPMLGQESVDGKYMEHHPRPRMGQIIAWPLCASKAKFRQSQC